MLSTMSDDGWWYWDLRRKCAVPAAERGPASDLLGPYRSREEAEHWRDTVERRNERWEDDDEAWRGEPSHDDPSDRHD
jgi:hypothetical protein